MSHGDGKFVIVAGEIVKASNGETIPEDEPIMIFRARDHLALSVLRYYRELCVGDGCTEYHLRGCEDRISAFERFAHEFPECMKQPGVTEGK